MTLKIELGRCGFDIKNESERPRFLVSCGDVEVGIGPYTVNAQSKRAGLNGLYVRTPASERHWYWDEVRAWLIRTPLTPPSAA